jgi:hypothetical protein
LNIDWQLDGEAGVSATGAAIISAKDQCGVPFEQAEKFR